MKVSILMLTYNAPKYVLQSILGVKKTKGVEYELVVVDNCSKSITRILLRCLYCLGFIDKLVLNKENYLFAKGNNIASTYSEKNCTHYLLLYSDVKIMRSDWLQVLCKLHSINGGGVSSYGAVLSAPKRADGYCFLIDKNIYDKYQLDENFEWWWSVTKLESQVLAEGLPIQAVSNHEFYLHHYGGASGKGYANAKGMDVEVSEVVRWFDTAKAQVTIIDEIKQI